MRSIERNPRGDWVVPIDGWEVTRCCVDFGFELLLAGEGTSASLRLEGECTLTHNGKELTVVPEESPAAIGQYVVLLRDHIASATATDGGALEIQFGSGARLTVPADPAFEAWVIATGSSGFRLVSIPGGDLAIWQPEPE
jgi:hypothetical protein